MPRVFSSFFFVNRSILSNFTNLMVSIFPRRRGFSSWKNELKQHGNGETHRRKTLSTSPEAGKRINLVLSDSKLRSGCRNTRGSDWGSFSGIEILKNTNSFPGLF